MLIFRGKKNLVLERQEREKEGRGLLKIYCCPFRWENTEAGSCLLDLDVATWGT